METKTGKVGPLQRVQDDRWRFEFFCFVLFCFVFCSIRCSGLYGASNRLIGPGSGEISDLLTLGKC